MAKLTFSAYQNGAMSTAVFPAVKIVGDGDEEDVTVEFVYPCIGLSNEIGEVQGKLKKIIRDKKGTIGNDDLEAISAELGDVLWYVAAVADSLGLDLETIASYNLSKLSSRKKRGKIKGSGDNR